MDVIRSKISSGVNDLSEELDMDSRFIKLVDNFDYEYDYVCSFESVFYATTNDHAPKQKLVKIDISRKDPKWIDDSLS